MFYYRAKILGSESLPSLFSLVCLNLSPAGRITRVCRLHALAYTEMDDFTVLKRHEKNYCTKSPPYIHDREHIIL